jgi:hypothetical protein
MSDTSKVVDNTFEAEIKQDKTWRVNLDNILQEIKCLKKSRERSICITKLQEAIMWLGMDMKEMNSTNPYPQSYNPSNAVVEKTADNLKL